MNKCNFCGREFAKEKTLYSHLCEKGRRHKNKDLKHVQIGFTIFQKFFKILQGPRTSKTYEEFCASPYYLAFVKWGRYVMDVNCFDILAYGDWLIKKEIPVDKWATDSIYTEWLKEWVYIEDHWQSAERGLNTMQDWAEANQSILGHYFNYAAKPRIIADIQAGKITGWVIYCSQSGLVWLEGLDPQEIGYIWPLINSDKWHKRFHDYSYMKKEVMDLCNKAGL